MQSDGARVGIVVTAFNNADTIVQCISSLETQSFQEKMLMVVCDTASTDSTELTLDQYCQSKPSVILAKCTGVGRSEARNLGWRSCRTPVVMFADGDDIYDPGYLEKAVASLDVSPRAGGVCMGGLPLANGGRLLDEYYRAYGSRNAKGYEKIREGSRTPDWAWVYRKECLEKIGGFDEHLSQGEDRDLCTRVKRAGYEISYVPGVNWYRRKPSTVRAFLRKEYNAGKRRIFYNHKYHKHGATALALAPLGILALLIAAAVYLGALVAGTILAMGLAYYAVRFSRGVGSKRSLAVGYALLAICARFSSSLGTLFGLLTFIGIRLKIVSADPGRF